jgi:hypothetical protein
MVDLRKLKEIEDLQARQNGLVARRLVLREAEKDHALTDLVQQFSDFFRGAGFELSAQGHFGAIAKYGNLTYTLTHEKVPRRGSFLGVLQIAGKFDQAQTLYVAVVDTDALVPTVRTAEAIDEQIRALQSAITISEQAASAEHALHSQIRYKFDAPNASLPVTEMHVTDSLSAVLAANLTI